MLIVDYDEYGECTATYNSLWDAAAAIDAMCVKHRRSGWARDIGKCEESRYLAILDMLATGLVIFIDLGFPRKIYTVTEHDHPRSNTTLNTF